MGFSDGGLSEGPRWNSVIADRAGSGHAATAPLIVAMKLLDSYIAD